MNLSNGPKQFKKIFENRDKKNASSMFKESCKDCSIEMPKFDRVVGKPVKVNDRIIYPIIEIATIGNKMQNFKGIEIFPIALVIEEAGEKYAVSLTGEEIDPDEFIGMVSKK